MIRVSRRSPVNVTSGAAEYRFSGDSRESRKRRIEKHEMPPAGSSCANSAWRYFLEISATGIAIGAGMVNWGILATPFSGSYLEWPR
jgi:hypothetical protein